MSIYGNPVVLGGSGGGGGGDMHNYSTQEQVVGTWIDGKPLYEIVIESTLTSIDVSGLNIEKLIYSDALGSDQSSYGTTRWMLNSVTNNQGRILYINNGTLKREGGFYTFAVILQYTKTTDTV